MSLASSRVFALPKLIGLNYDRLCRYLVVVGVLVGLLVEVWFGRFSI
jgi:hypothetical protein